MNAQEAKAIVTDALGTEFNGFQLHDLVLVDDDSVVPLSHDWIGIQWMVRLDGRDGGFYGDLSTNGYERVKLEGVSRVDQRSSEVRHFYDHATVAWQLGQGMSGRQSSPDSVIHPD